MKPKERTRHRTSASQQWKIALAYSVLHLLPSDPRKAHAVLALVSKLVDTATAHKEGHHG